MIAKAKRCDFPNCPKPPVRMVPVYSQQIFPRVKPGRTEMRPMCAEHAHRHEKATK